MTIERDSAQLSPLDRRVNIVSWHGNYHPVRALTVSGQLAGKWVNEVFTDSLASVASSYRAQLVSGRVVYDITERWDAGVSGSVLRAGDGARQYGLGVELPCAARQPLAVGGLQPHRLQSDDDLVDSDYSAARPRTSGCWSSTALRWTRFQDQRTGAAMTPSPRNILLPLLVLAACSGGPQRPPRDLAGAPVPQQLPVAERGRITDGAVRRDFSYIEACAAHPCAERAEVPAGGCD
ncbi:MAG: hypothetical protein IPJ97_16745 [Proteobacteria bacterium]|nr:hypothetical protein [Pseudomonadota bacterium]